eukprot:7536691-Alexandrium_andersonii.AAC.1
MQTASSTLKCAAKLLARLKKVFPATVGDAWGPNARWAIRCAVVDDCAQQREREFVFLVSLQHGQSFWVVPLEELVGGRLGCLRIPLPMKFEAVLTSLLRSHGAALSLSQGDVE